MNELESIRTPILKNTSLLSLFIGITAIISSAILLIDKNVPHYYNLLWFQPIFFLISYLPFALYCKRGLALYSLIIILVYYIRMVATPILMLVGNFYSIIDSSLFQNSLDISIILTCYENVFVFFFLAYISQNDFSEKKSFFIKREKIVKPTRKLKFGILFLILCVICILLKDPSIILHAFLNILDTENTYFALSDPTKGVGSLNMYVQILGALFKMIQIILPPFLLYYILKIRSYYIKVFVSIVLTLFICLISTEDRIDALLAALAFVLTMQTVFGSKFRKQSVAFLSIITIVCFLGLLIKGESRGGYSGFEGASSTIAAYFSGLPTVATGLEFYENTNSLYIFQIVPDILSKIPFLPYFINYFFDIDFQNTNQLFNDYITNSLGYGLAQILPTTAVGVNYFGVLLAPTYPCIFVMLARYYWKKSFGQRDMIIRNIYIWITISIALCPVVMSGLLIVGKISWFYISYGFVKILNK